MNSPSRLSRLALVVALAAANTAHATWSIALADSETGEVAVGTVTCLTGLDLLSIVPVVVVGKGAGACQAAGDFDGIRRPVIFDGLTAGTAPEDILAELALISGHQSRQYGIVDANGAAVTFTGSQNGAWASGVTGSAGTLVYAIQGNVLAGPCVVSAIQSAILLSGADVPGKLMAGMQAARAAGGDGRCSCSFSSPTSCGCPPPSFTKAGHIGGMVVARAGDADDPACNASGCVDGDYFMRLDVANQGSGDPDPVTQLTSLFAAWRADLEGRPDAIRSSVSFDPPHIPANGTSTTTMTITLRDWRSLPITSPVETITVEHAPDSAGLSTIGAVLGSGDTFIVTLTAGTGPGVDRFIVTVDDGQRPVILMPPPALEYFPLGDLNNDGVVSFADVLVLLGAWGPCGACPEDLDGDGAVGFGDLLVLLGEWT